ncbi:MAG: hypothetical protein KDJ65_27645 [Anaerolineae bacterium]|nr:hypothetical protein [Anaerolineae bacterium]
MKNYQKLIDQKPIYLNYRLYAYRATLNQYLYNLDEELGRVIDDNEKIQELKAHIQIHPVLQQIFDKNIPPTELVKTYFQLGCQDAKEDFLDYLNESLRDPKKIKTIQVYIDDYCQD